MSRRHDPRPEGDGGIFSGADVGSEGTDLEPFMTTHHIAFGGGAVASQSRAVVSAMPGPHRPETVAAAPRPTPPAPA